MGRDGSWEDGALGMDTIRDIFIIVFTGMAALTALVVLFATFFTFRKVSRVLKSVGNAVENVEKLSKPLASGSSAGFGVGSVLGFLTGMGKRGKKKK